MSVSMQHMLGMDSGSVSLSMYTHVSMTHVDNVCMSMHAHAEGMLRMHTCILMSVWNSLEKRVFMTLAS